MNQEKFVQPKTIKVSNIHNTTNGTYISANKLKFSPSDLNTVQQKQNEQSNLSIRLIKQIENQKANYSQTISELEQSDGLRIKRTAKSSHGLTRPIRLGNKGSRLENTIQNESFRLDDPFNFTGTVLKQNKSNDRTSFLKSANPATKAQTSIKVISKGR